MSNIVAVPKTEYETLRKKARMYEELASLFFQKVKGDTVGEIVNDFKKTSLYSKGFLRDLENGLRFSSKAKK